jgi:Viral BACON domain
VATSGDTVTMPPGGSATITHTASPAGLSAGTYSGTATISGSGITTRVIPITMAVTAAGGTSPAIGLSTTSLAFTGSIGRVNPGAQTINIANTGGGTLNWSTSENASWLTVSPASGSGTGTVTVAVNDANLSAGTYNATITVAASGATTKSVPVTLTVTSGSTTPAIGLNPISLAFTGSVGGANPAAQSINIANTGGGTLSWSTSDSVPWLTLSPASGSGNKAVTATVNTAGLATGTLNATITVAATGAPTKTVPVTLTMTAPSTGAASLNWSASTSSDAAGYKVYKATASGAYGAPIATLQGKNVVSYQAIGLLINTTYFFVVTSYDTAGNESSHSNEVSKSIF